MTKHYITPEEHARLQRRRGRQALGLLITILVLVGFVTVLRAGVGLVANLFDDTAQKQEYEDKLFENQQLLRTPIVRNGRKATVGYQPDVWKDWE